MITVFMKVLCTVVGGWQGNVTGDEMHYISKGCGQYYEHYIVIQYFNSLSHS